LYLLEANPEELESDLILSSTYEKILKIINNED
jgi:hypothetical protein